MADRLDDLAGDVRAIGQKLDRLSGTVDGRFAQVDQGFDGIEAALVEHREYTEFAHERLDKKMDAGFARIERKLDQIVDLHIARTPPRTPESPQ